MKQTIFGKDSSALTSTPLPISDDEPQVALATGEPIPPSDMEVSDPNGLGWLDEELPNLSTVSHYQFDLEQEFDVRRYLDILADEASGPTPVRVGSVTGSTSTSKVDKSGNASASTVAPAASEWDT